MEATAQRASFVHEARQLVCDVVDERVERIAGHVKAADVEYFGEAFPDAGGARLEWLGRCPAVPDPVVYLPGGSDVLQDPLFFDTAARWLS